jgi:copper chaperone CopZ
MKRICSYAAAIAAATVLAGIDPHSAAASATVGSPQARTAPNASDTVRLKVDGMTCGGCAVSARLVLQRLDGVLKAEVDYDTKIARVVFDAKRVSPEKMIRALMEKLKYTAIVLPLERT